MLEKSRTQSIWGGVHDMTGALCLPEESLPWVLAAVFSFLRSLNAYTWGPLLFRVSSHSSTPHVVTITRSLSNRYRVTKRPELRDSAQRITGDTEKKAYMLRSNGKSETQKKERDACLCVPIGRNLWCGSGLLLQSGVCLGGRGGGGTWQGTDCRLNRLAFLLDHLGPAWLLIVLTYIAIFEWPSCLVGRTVNKLLRKWLEKRHPAPVTPVTARFIIWAL